MQKTATRNKLSAVLVAVTLLGGTFAAAQTTRTVGAITVLGGSLEYQANKTAPVRRLLTNGKYPVTLIPGSRFHLSDAASRATVTLFGRTATLHGPLPWQTVPYLTAGGRDTPAAIALREIARPGGRLRGDENTTSTFYAPCPGSAVSLTPSSAPIPRWNPPIRPATATLYLRRNQGDRALLWSAGGIPLAAGELPEPLRQSLIERLQQAQAAGDISFTLSLVPKGGVPDRILTGDATRYSTMFSLLSPADETKLATALSHSEPGNESMNATIYETFRLFSDAALAHDAALAAKPDSLPQIRAALDAARLSGNKARIAELELRSLLTPEND